MSRDLLLEIGTEELPARFIPGALEHMRVRAAEDLTRLRIDYTDVSVYGTPRRLALYVSGVAERQRDLVKELKGPSKKVAFTADGAATKAAEGFARGLGVDVATLEIRQTEQGEYVFAVVREEGSVADEVLARWLPGFVTDIPFPKSMRWGTGSMRFARPIRWLVALLGENVLSFTVDGVEAGRTTAGHRFLSPRPVVLDRADEYVSRLRDAYVIVDVDERKATVEQAVRSAADEAGGHVVDDGSLIEQVANLVEYPAALVGSFADEYLTLPMEVLVTPMREHQRYFPLADAAGRILPRFVAVGNGPRPDPDVVRRGNEKVLAARLADARFFYDEDQKRPLRMNVNALRDVVFHHKLGTLYDKTMRIQALAEKVASAVGAGEPIRAAAKEGAYLAKADLVSQMVQEFPELQGVMGRQYARLSGEADAVAQVVFEHYLPRHTGDELPGSEAGQIVAIADKIDTIVGCFGVGLIPTGSQDPYALRRQALGVVRIVLAASLALDLHRLAEQSYDLFHVPLADRAETTAKVTEFFRQRLRGLLIEEGIRHDVADAAISVDGDRPASVASRARALQQFSEADQFGALMTAYERLANLARHARGDDVNPVLFEAEAEHGLYRTSEHVAAHLPRWLDEANYGEALAALANLGPAVDRLFADVMVMADDEAVRANRLALLRRTLNLFHAVARFDTIVMSRT